MGFIAVQEGKKVGLLTFKFDDQECEIITFNSLKANIGIGPKLVNRIEEFAISEGCRCI